MSIIDMVPATETIRIAGAEYQLRGLSAKKIALVFGRFPWLNEAINRQTVEDVVGMIGTVPEALTEAIRLGIRNATPELLTMIEEELPVELQWDLLERIIKLTAPSGPRPFVERVKTFLSFDAGPPPRGNGASAPAVGQDVAAGSSTSSPASPLN